MTDVKNNDMTKVVSMTQIEFQLELNKARLEQKAIDDDHLREVKGMVVDKACKWLNAQLYTDDGGNLASEWYQDLGEFVESFRKAMEE